VAAWRRTWSHEIPFFACPPHIRRVICTTNGIESINARLRKTISALMDGAEDDVLAFMTFPRAHWTQIYITNPLERLNAEIKRRTRVVGIFPNDAAIVRLVGAMMFEQNDEWSLNRRCMLLEGLQTLCDTAPTRLSAVAR
jgi:putative transposase